MSSGFSGGVAYNNAIVSTVRNIAEEEGFEFVVHTKVPCGDGGDKPRASDDGGEGV